jgi:CheY-like chemotaxis protein
MKFLSHENVVARYATEGHGEAVTQTARSILIVDDDSGIRGMLAAFLEAEGYQCESARNGKDALSRLRDSESPPCIILLDLNMPIMTGWEFRRQQQQDPALASIPVAVISADRNLANQSTAIDAVEFFKKPIDLRRLLMLIEEHCS